MLWFIILLGIIWMLACLFSFVKARLAAKNQKPWDPFESWQMTTLIERSDGSTFTRSFKRFEYVGQKTDEGVIIGIYTDEVRPKSKRQLKYEQLCEKWR